MSYQALRFDMPIQSYGYYYKLKRLLYFAGVRRVVLQNLLLITYILYTLYNNRKEWCKINKYNII